MVHLSERRKYKRCNGVIAKALVSRDKIRWASFDIIDLSAGGMLFSSVHRYNANMMLYFNLFIHNMLSECNIKIQGKVLRADEINGTNTYAVQFENMNKYEILQLDELVKSRISAKDIPHRSLGNEEYSKLLFPKVMPRLHKARIKESTK